MNWWGKNGNVKEKGAKKVEKAQGRGNGVEKGDRMSVGRGKGAAACGYPEGRGGVQRKSTAHRGEGRERTHRSTQTLRRFSAW